MQKEIDVLIEKDGKLHPIEIKLTANPNKHMVKNFNLIDNAGEGALVCLSDKLFRLTDEVKAIPVSYI